MAAGKTFQITFKINGQLDSTFSKAIEAAEKQMQALRNMGDVSKVLSNPMVQKFGQTLAAMQGLQKSSERLATVLRPALTEAQAAMTRANQQAAQFAQRQQTAVQDASKLKRQYEQLNATFKATKGKLPADEVEKMRKQLEQLKTDWKASAEAAKAAGKDYTAALKAARTAAKDFDNTWKMIRQESLLRDNALKALRELGVNTSAIRSQEALEAAINRTTAALQRQVEVAVRRQNFQTSLDEFSGAYNNMQNVISSAQTALTPFTASVETAKDFEKQMSIVKSLTQMDNLRIGNLEKVNSEMKALTEMAEHLGMTTKFTALQAAQGETYLAYAGLTTPQILGLMPTVLNVAQAAGMTDLGRVADIFTNIGMAFKIPFTQMEHVGDVLTYTFTHSNQNLEDLAETMKYAAPIARLFGSSLEETAAITKFMADSGIKGSMAGTATRSIMTRLVAPPKAAAEAMEDNGIALGDATKEWMDAQRVAQSYGIEMKEGLTPGKQMASVIRQINENMSELSAHEKLGIFKAITGMYALAGASNLFETGGELIDDKQNPGKKITRLEAFTRDLETSDGAAEQTAKVQIDNYAGSVTLLNSAFENLKMQAGQALTPALKMAVDAFTPLVAKAAEFVNQHPVIVQGAASIAAGFAGIAVAGAGITVLSKAWSVVTSGLILAKTEILNVARLFSNIPPALINASAAAAFLKTKFGAALTFIATKAGALMTAIRGLTFASIVSGISSLGAALVGLAVKIGNVIKALALFAVSPAGLALMALAAIAVAVYQNWDKVGPVLEHVAGVLGGSLSAAFQTVQPAISSAIKSFEHLFQVIGNGKSGEVLAKIFIAAVNVIVGALATMVDFAANAFAALADIIAGGADIVAHVAEGDWSGAWEAAKKHGSDFKEHAWNAATAIPRGIESTYANTQESFRIYDEREKNLPEEKRKAASVAYGKELQHQQVLSLQRQGINTDEYFKQRREEVYHRAKMRAAGYGHYDEYRQWHGDEEGFAEYQKASEAAYNARLDARQAKILQDAEAIGIQPVKKWNNDLQRFMYSLPDPAATAERKLFGGRTQKATDTSGNEVRDERTGNVKYVDRHALSAADLRAIAAAQEAPQITVPKVEPPPKQVQDYSKYAASYQAPNVPLKSVENPAPPSSVSELSRINEHAPEVAKQAAQQAAAIRVAESRAQAVRENSPKYLEPSTPMSYNPAQQAGFDATKFQATLGKTATPTPVPTPPAAPAPTVETKPKRTIDYIAGATSLATGITSADIDERIGGKRDTLGDYAGTLAKSMVYGPFYGAALPETIATIAAAIPGGAKRAQQRIDQRQASQSQEVAPEIPPLPAVEQRPAQTAGFLESLKDIFVPPAEKVIPQRIEQPAPPVPEPAWKNQTIPQPATPQQQEASLGGSFMAALSSVFSPVLTALNLSTSTAAAATPETVSQQLDTSNVQAQLNLLGTAASANATSLTTNAQNFTTASTNANQSLSAILNSTDAFGQHLLSISANSAAANQSITEISSAAENANQSLSAVSESISDVQNATQSTSESMQAVQAPAQETANSLEQSASTIQTVNETFSQVTQSISESVSQISTTFSEALAAAGTSITESTALITTSTVTLNESLTVTTASASLVNETFAQTSATVLTFNAETQTLTASFTANNSIVQQSTASFTTNTAAVQQNSSAAQAAAASLNALSGAAQGAVGGISALGSSSAGAAGSVSALGIAASNAVATMQSASASIASVAASARAAAAGAGRPAQNYKGGIYNHGAFLTWFAEKSPEAAIPIDGSDRAINLWQQTGAMLGVYPGTGSFESAPNLIPAENYSGGIYASGGRSISTSVNASPVAQAYRFNRSANSLPNYNFDTTSIQPTYNFQNEAFSNFAQGSSNLFSAATSLQEVSKNGTQIFQQSQSTLEAVNATADSRYRLYESRTPRNSGIVPLSGGEGIVQSAIPETPARISQKTYERAGTVSNNGGQSLQQIYGDSLESRVAFSQALTDIRRNGGSADVLQQSIWQNAAQSAVENSVRTASTRNLDRSNKNRTDSTNTRSKNFIEKGAEAVNDFFYRIFHPRKWKKQQEIKKRGYETDELGNIVGLNGLEDNYITGEETIQVQRAKREAQLREYREMRERLDRGEEYPSIVSERAAFEEVPQPVPNAKTQQIVSRQQAKVPEWSLKPTPTFPTPVQSGGNIFSGGVLNPIKNIVSTQTGSGGNILEQIFTPSTVKRQREMGAALNEARERNLSDEVKRSKTYQTLTTARTGSRYKSMAETHQWNGRGVIDQFNRGNWKGALGVLGQMYSNSLEIKNRESILNPATSTVANTSLANASTNLANVSEDQKAVQNSQSNINVKPKNFLQKGFESVSNYFYKIFHPRKYAAKQLGLETDKLGNIKNLGGNPENIITEDDDKRVRRSKEIAQYYEYKKKKMEGRADEPAPSITQTNTEKPAGEKPARRKNFLEKTIEAATNMVNPAGKRNAFFDWDFSKDMTSNLGRVIHNMFGGDQSGIHNSSWDILAGTATGGREGDAIFNPSYTSSPKLPATVFNPNVGGNIFGGGIFNPIKNIVSTQTGSGGNILEQIFTPNTVKRQREMQGALDYSRSIRLSDDVKNSRSYQALTTARTNSRHRAMMSTQQWSGRGVIDQLKRGNWKGALGVLGQMYSNSLEIKDRQNQLGLPPQTFPIPQQKTGGLNFPTQTTTPPFVNVPSIAKMPLPVMHQNSAVTTNAPSNLIQTFSTNAAANNVSHGAQLAQSDFLNASNSGGTFQQLDNSSRSTTSESMSMPPINLTFNITVQGNADRGEIEAGVRQSMPIVQESFESQWNKFQHEQQRRSMLW